MTPTNRVNPPELPSELWLKIHQFATFVPGLLDPDLALDFSPTSRRTRRRLLRDSLVTKRYLVRVCKWWRSLALPFLYESLYIGRGRTLISLVRTLMISKAQHRALGRWTKRIDVAMRDQIGVSGKDHDVDREIRLLERIFSYLPNLAIINFDITAPSYAWTVLDPRALNVIANTSGRCLRALVWHKFTLLPSNPDLQSFLSETPNVMTIHCPRTPFIFDSTIRLKALNNILIIVDDTVGPPLLDLPPFLPLRRVGMVTVSNAGITPQATLLEKYGGSISVFQLGEQMLNTLPQDLQLISKSCPNLTRLDISFFDVIDYEVNWSDLPGSIETLGLQYAKGRQPKRVYKELLEGPYRVQPGRNLKVIQFIDETNVKDLKERYYNALSGPAGRLADLGLKLHDHEGRLMY